MTSTDPGEPPTDSHRLECREAPSGLGIETKARGDAMRCFAMRSRANLTKGPLGTIERRELDSTAKLRVVRRSEP